ncbi:hypothetical protein PC9H_005731 [Pleurotus ostreatus]|uniref:DUF6697 domain-containing protein n=1 Tax=Pleurotus ostreatus TaxID=5322 RepID=A0A8H6ZZI5_PLEOS|nr:uncharacterized protein PC9H_005731 [Pleurotus ostreatus]KAF7433766.1 hypothetical protein PC9H_005731 [Pleurotus ostreatus]KAJ8697445.1 hypothetical protein PTI98_004252 [Pleurotus ostreatus]
MAMTFGWKSEEEDTKMKIEEVDTKPILKSSTSPTPRLPKTEDNDVKLTFVKAESEEAAKVEKAEPADIEMLSVCEDSEEERMFGAKAAKPTPHVDEPFQRNATAGPSCPDNAQSTTRTEQDRTPLVHRPDKLNKRLVFEAVQVPTLEDVLKSYRVQAKLPDHREEVKEVKKAKVKKNNMEWNLDTVTRRLDAIGHDLYPIDLPDDIKQACFSRNFLCNLYGGNIRKTFPFDNKDDDDLVRGVPKNEFMYPNLNYNPHLPLIPGAPGLYSQANYPAGAGPWPRIQRVMVRVRVGVWQYMGHYELIPTTSLTRDEWKEQDVIVRRTWARKIFDKGWGRPLRASITLRKRLGREPTHKEQQEALATDKTFQSDITAADIAAAFDRGEQALSMWCMKCVGYDTEFQRFLVARSATTTIPNARRDL